MLWNPVSPYDDESELLNAELMREVYAPSYLRSQARIDSLMQRWNAKTNADWFERQTMIRLQSNGTDDEKAMANEWFRLHDLRFRDFIKRYPMRG